MIKKKESNKDWLTIEKITAILEKYISPNSKVEHNQRLPTLGRNGFRQCDIVITVEEPRKHVTIVEVQKRNKPIDINTFGGWLNKMESIGVQQLICVSKEKYPQSIIDEVKRVGKNNVTLMTLQEFDFLDKPELTKTFKLSQTDLYKYAISKIECLSFRLDSIFNISESEFLELNTNDLVFGEINSTNLLSVNDCLCEAVTKRSNIAELYSNGFTKVNMKFKVEKEHKVYFHHKGNKHLINNLEIQFCLQIYKLDELINWKTFKYHQEINEGNLAWFARGNFEVEDEKIEIDIIFKTNNGLSIHSEISSNKNLRKWNAFVADRKVLIHSSLMGI